jgi:ureidoglycolate lyase
MASPGKTKLTAPNLVLEALPLTREAFAPFGDVIENPRPNVHPSSMSSSTSLGSAAVTLPFDAISANQGSAIKYQHVTRPINLYSKAPSGRSGVAVTNMFVCASRGEDALPIPILERHPYTTQTFVPLQSNNRDKGNGYGYLVLVAPTLPNPHTKDGSGGLPDLGGLRAFVASADGQAVTYGAGTWHAPMVALGSPGTAVDFVVVQFANGVAEEDCQEVYLESREQGGGRGVVVKVGRDRLSGKVGASKLSKL